MRSRIFGGILTAMGIIGMASIARRLAEAVWVVALFVIFALFTADGVATIVTNCRGGDRE